MIVPANAFNNSLENDVGIRIEDFILKPARHSELLEWLPDIVLLDVMMPGMDGFRVAKRLKANTATAHIPIIFMAGLT